VAGTQLDVTSFLCILTHGFDTESDRFTKRGLAIDVCETSVADKKKKKKFMRQSNHFADE